MFHFGIDFLLFFLLMCLVKHANDRIILFIVVEPMSLFDDERHIKKKKDFLIVVCFVSFIYSRRIVFFPYLIISFEQLTMESFLRRMSSIVRKNPHQSFDPGDHQNDDDQEEEEEEEENHFHRLQQRRQSAPDIRRRANQTDKIRTELDQKVISVEEINSQTHIRHTNTSSFIRKQSHSTGKSFFDLDELKNNE